MKCYLLNQPGILVAAWAGREQVEVLLLGSGIQRRKYNQRKEKRKFQKLFLFQQNPRWQWKSKIRNVEEQDESKKKKHECVHKTTFASSKILFKKKYNMWRSYTRNFK